MKKIVSVLLALVMALSVVCVTAFATDLTIREPDGMKNADYAGYMILKATNSADDHTKFAYTLSSKYADVLKSVTEKNTEADIVKYISELDAGGMRAFADKVYDAIKAANIAADAALASGSNTVEAGYWLIAQTSDAPAGETQSLTMVDTAGKDALTIDTKKDGVIVEKQVSDDGYLKCGKQGDPTHVHEKSCYNWKNANEAALGDTVPFDIRSKVPTNADGYKYMYFIIGDTLSGGLALNKDSVKVYIGGKLADEGKDYSLVISEDGQHFDVALVDAKAHPGEDVEVFYTAVVDTDAIIGVEGNPNEVDVTYSTKPNYDYKPDEDEVPGFPNADKNVPVGTTPKDYTRTYVTDIKFMKIDGENGNPLKGAEFTIKGNSLNIVLHYVETFSVDRNGNYWKLRNNTYTTEAPQMNDIMERVSTAYDRSNGGYVVAESGYAGKDAVTVDGVVYRPATESEMQGDAVLYILHKCNVDSYADTSVKYALSGHWESLSTSDKKTVTAAVNDDGVVILAGLGEGTYTVSETKVPEGFNKINDFTVSIHWNDPTMANQTNPVWTGTVTMNGKTEAISLVDMGDDDVTGESEVFYLEVENFSGVELPSTGGIGTYIFYALGGLLVLSAGVLFVTRKRMGEEE